MDKISFASTTVRTNEPPAGTVSGPVLLDMLSLVHLADGKTLCSLASIGKSGWTVIGVVTLHSYFQAARVVYCDSEASDRRRIFNALNRWLQMVGDQLPAETRHSMLHDLLSMAVLPGIGWGETIVAVLEVRQSIKHFSALAQATHDAGMDHSALVTIADKICPYTSEAPDNEIAFVMELNKLAKLSMD